MDITFLFVCKANICRSPGAAAIFRHRLREYQQDGLVAVRSAGTDADPGQPSCPSALRAVGRSVPDEFGLAERTSVKLQPGMLERATLVLAADRETSASALRMAPSVRPRLFTMVEAARLASFVLDGSERQTEPVATPELVTIRPRPAASPANSIRWFTTEMNAARGQLPVPHEARGRWWRSKTSPGWNDEVPDAHQGAGAGDHVRTFAIVTMSMNSFAESVSRVITPATTSAATS